jgi:adenylate cyclase
MAHKQNQGQKSTDYLNTYRKKLQQNSTSLEHLCVYILVYTLLYCMHPPIPFPISSPLPLGFLFQESGERDEGEQWRG